MRHRKRDGHALLAKALSLIGRGDAAHDVHPRGGLDESRERRSASRSPERRAVMARGETLSVARVMCHGRPGVKGRIERSKDAEERKMMIKTAYVAFIP